MKNKNLSGLLLILLSGVVNAQQVNVPAGSPSMQPNMQAPQQSVGNQIPLNGGTPQVMPATPAPPALSMPTDSFGKKDVRQTLKQINEKNAELSLIKLEAELAKAREPFFQKQQVEIEKNQSAALEAIRNKQKEQEVVSYNTTVSVLAVGGLKENLTASLKVGDLFVKAKKGDTLPSGHRVKDVQFDHVIVQLKGKKSEQIFVSSADSSAYYGSKYKDATPAAPMQTNNASVMPQNTSLPSLPLLK